MDKRLYIFFGIVILVGGFQQIISRQGKKVDTLRQCCDGGCTCSNNTDNKDRDTRN